MAATSDTYMELSDPEVWGETHDATYGEHGRNLGGFEVSKFEFKVGDPSTSAKKAKTPVATPGTSSRTTTNAPTATGNEETEQKTFTISKYVDKGSPDLFLVCCTKTKIKWGIISVRETGGSTREPYLVLEFHNLKIASFGWDITADPEAASGMETIEFTYEAILIKYFRQDLSGGHPVMKMKGYNFANRTEQVEQVDPSLQQQMEQQ